MPLQVLKHSDRLRLVSRPDDTISMITERFDVDLRVGHCEGSDTVSIDVVSLREFDSVAVDYERWLNQYKVMLFDVKCAAFVLASEFGEDLFVEINFLSPAGALHPEALKEALHRRNYIECVPSGRWLWDVRVYNATDSDYIPVEKTTAKTVLERFDNASEF